MGVAFWVEFCFWKPGGQESRVLSSPFGSVPTKSHQPDIVALSLGCGVRRSWVQIPTLLLTYWPRGLGQVSKLPEILFSYLEGRGNNSPAHS